MKLIFYWLIFLIESVLSFDTVAPLWRTSNYFRAGQENVINTLTGNDKTPNYTFTFSSPLSGLPNIAYGIAKYQGIDLLLQEYFQIFRIGLTSSSFSVAVQITGSTSLFILRVPYLAIEPTFPHHLNTFDNVPLNYSQGNLVNISVRSLSETTYENVINYTQQAAGRRYDRFNNSLSDYKIVLLMTSLFVTTISSSGAQTNAMDLRMSSAILSAQTYQLKVRLKINVIVTRLRFSQIFFDAKDIQSSNKYKLVFQEWEVDNMGGFKAIPSAFKDNFIMGITEFTTPLGQCGFDYMWDWKENSTFFGVFIYESITRKSICAFNRIISAIVYIQTWQCLSPHYYYNASTGLCQDKCGMYFHQFNISNDIEVDYLCKPCQWACSKCSESNKCLECNSDDMRLYNGSCYCPNGYLDTLVVTKCEPCVDPHCLICEKNAQYKANPLPDDPITAGLKNLCILCANGYFLNLTDRTCVVVPTCDSSRNQILNYQTNTCQACPVEGCIECRQTQQLMFNNTLMDIMQVGTRKRRSLVHSSPYGIVTCALCDQANQYFMNLTTKSCQLCEIDNCIQCSSLYTCASCDIVQQYFLDKKTKLCEQCTLEGCLDCMNLTSCKVCDYLRGYFMDEVTKTCRLCGLGCTRCQLSDNSSMESSCLECSANLTLSNSRCFCPKGHYLTVISGQSFTSCQACDSKCKRCENSSQICTACYFQQNRLLNGNLCECNSTNYIEVVNSTVCQKVDLSLCDMGYHFSQSSQRCEQICGDGARIEYGCDDGNLINRDGCSSQCEVEKDFVCSDQIYELSECQYVGNVWVPRYNVTKEPYENVFVLNLELQPELVLYKQLDWRRMTKFIGETEIDLLQARMMNEKVLLIKGRYHENIKYLNITLNLVEPQSSSSQLSTSNQSYGTDQSRLLQQALLVDVTFTFIPITLDFTSTTNNLQIVYYSSETYSELKQLQEWFYILSMVYLVIVLGTLFFMKRVVTVLVVFVLLQACFISLSSVQNLQPQTFSIVNSFDEVFGLNNLHIFNSYCSDNDMIDKRFANLKFESCFVANLNLMVIFQFCSIVGILIGTLIKLRWKIGKKIVSFFRRALSNFVFFNLSNLVISIGLMDWKSYTTLQICLVCFQGFMTVVHILLIAKGDKKHFIKIDTKDLLKSASQNRNQIVNEEKQRIKNFQIREIYEEIDSRVNDSDGKQVRKQEPDNFQGLYFTFFTIGMGCVSPLLYFFMKENTLVSNLSTIGIILILVAIQLIMKPFESVDQQYRSFSKVSKNYYIAYLLAVCFFTTNLLFSLMQSMYETGQIEKRIQYTSIISYIQIAIFLSILTYVLFAWSYAVYLSFFQKQVLRNHRIYTIERKSSSESEIDLLNNESREIRSSQLISDRQDKNNADRKRKRKQQKLRRMNMNINQLSDQRQSTVLEPHYNHDEVGKYRF